MGEEKVNIPLIQTVETEGSHWAGCLWQAIFNGIGGSENSPPTILSKIHLFAASVKWTPSQLILTDGSLHDPTTTSFPSTFTFPPHPTWMLQLYFPPCPQHAVNGCTNPAIVSHVHIRQYARNHVKLGMAKGGYGMCHSHSIPAPDNIVIFHAQHMHKPRQVDQLPSPRINNPILINKRIMSQTGKWVNITHGFESLFKSIFESILHQIHYFKSFRIPLELYSQTKTSR